jgi:diadenosine tetraphosphate (Ap4A) HIT family hydrolase
MDCIICDKKFEKNILFENDFVTIMLAVEPSVNGHIQIFSKQHHTIIEQASDEELSYMIATANQISMVLFEALKVHGTNIIINNGVPAGQKIPHFSVDILPRRTDDNLKLDWALKQATPEALESVQRIIGEGMNRPDTQIVEASPDVPEPKPSAKPESLSDTRKARYDDDAKPNDDVIEEKKTNFYHQIFERIP